MTYQIALCDDETAELKKTENLLRGYEKMHSELELIVECFESAGELLYLIEEKNYSPDLIFMDIFMPGQEGTSACLGIEAAKRLRDVGNRAKLVFLTTSKEYALEAFDVDALQYIVKPVPKDKLFSVLDSVLQDIEEERRKYILLRIEGCFVRVSLNEIAYCEAQGKTQYMYLSDGTQYILRMTMTELYEQLSQYQEFVRIGVAFIVNLGYVGGLNAKEIHMDNGMKIYLPRGSYKELREHYFSYYCKEDA